MNRPVLKPSPAHPITVGPTGHRVTVRVDGAVVADTDAALTLRESTYPAVQYIPISAVDKARLRRSESTTYCPFKGEAAYYHLITPAGEEIADAVWTYEQPFEAVTDIAGHVAFYPAKAQVTVGG